MNQKDKQKVSSALLLNIFSFLIIFLLGAIILPKNAIAGTNQKAQNSFYVSVINNVLPETKLGNKEKNNSSTSDMKSAILSSLGIYISNPISIIKKEISYLDAASVDNESNGEKRKTLALIPFNLDDNQVNKVGNEVGGASITDINNPALKQTLNEAKPRVLIYHSHTTESYLSSDADTSTDFFKSDLTQGVCEVGAVIANSLEKNYGISAINDDTIHNVGDYPASYLKSRVTLNKYLKKYGDFDIIIDLHRDGVDPKKEVKTKVDGLDIGHVMFVMTDENPRYAAQKKLVTSIIGISNKLYPGLIDYRQVYVYHRGINFYSQDRSNNAMLIEVGNNNSTIAEAKNTGLFLSRIIAEQLNGKK